MPKRVFTQTFGVVAAIIERDGKFLMMKEALRRHDLGKWNHPAGWLDVGENPVEAVAREVLEETGYEFTPTALLGVYSLVRADLRNQMEDEAALPHCVKLVYVGDISDNPVAPIEDDSDEVAWLSAEEILAMPMSVLRDEDIKTMVNDYLEGRRYPLESVRHCVQAEG